MSESNTCCDPCECTTGKDKCDCDDDCPCPCEEEESSSSPSSSSSDSSHSQVPDEKSSSDSSFTILKPAGLVVLNTTTLSDHKKWFPYVQGFVLGSCVAILGVALQTSECPFANLTLF